MGFLAIQKKAFEQLESTDQQVVRDVLSRIYSRIDAGSQKEAVAATKALINIGLQDIEPIPGEFDAIRAQMVETNREMAQNGMFSLEVLQKMQAYLAEYRASRTAAEAAGSSGHEPDSVAGTH
jgi:hypothetical protein